MRKVCEVYLVSSSATDERGVELTFPVSQYEMMDAFEQIHTKSPGDVYWQVDEFYCFDYLAPHLDESLSIFEFNSLTEQLSKLDERQETALEGLLQMQVNKHMQENGGPITVQVVNRDFQNWGERMAAFGEPAGEKVTAARPGHADFTGIRKYDRTDVRDILERSSARETTMRVAVGAVCKEFLKALGITVVSQVTCIGGVAIDPAKVDRAKLGTDISDLNC